MQIICAPLGWLMRLAYSLTGNYGLALILFTLMTKVVLLPVSLWVHANGIKMVRLEPAVNRLKVRYFGDPDKVADEQATLYKKEHYSPFASVIPVAVQVLLLIGLVVAIAAGFSIYWRKAKKKINKAVGREEVTKDESDNLEDL